MVRDLSEVHKIALSSFCSARQGSGSMCVCLVLVLDADFLPCRDVDRHDHMSALCYVHSHPSCWEITTTPSQRSSLSCFRLTMLEMWAREGPITSSLQTGFFSTDSFEYLFRMTAGNKLLTESRWGARATRGRKEDRCTGWMDGWMRIVFRSAPPKINIARGLYCTGWYTLTNRYGNARKCNWFKFLSDGFPESILFD